MKRETLDGTFELAPMGGSPQLAWCFREAKTNRLFRVSSKDKFRIFSETGDVLYSGTGERNYLSHHTTILNNRDIGQLVPWPEGCRSQGLLFIHGLPKNVSINGWLRAIDAGLKVQLEPIPALMDEDEECVSGLLEPFFETGTEGIVWSVYDPRQLGGSYEGLHPLQDGDELTIYSEDGSQILWQGTIQLEYKEYPYEIQGIQANVDHKVWAKMFFDELPAILKKRKPIKTES